MSLFEAMRDSSTLSPDRSGTGHENPVGPRWLRRRRVYELLEMGRREDPMSVVVDVALVGLIVISLIATTVESNAGAAVRWEQLLFWIEVVAVSIFSVEYVLRLVCAVERPEPRFRHPLWGRLRYALTPLSLADLVAIFPFYLSAFIGVDLRSLRILRLFRILKLTHYFTALDTLVDVIRMQRNALGAAYFVVAIGVLIASAGIYAFEHKAQPEVFSSVAAAIYWSVITLSTVGYGDVVPITGGGRVLSAMVIMLGAGTLTIPTTIVGTGFVLEVRRRRGVVEKIAADGFCDTCGQPVPMHEDLHSG